MRLATVGQNTEEQQEKKADHPDVNELFTMVRTQEENMVCYFILQYDEGNN